MSKFHDLSRFSEPWKKYWAVHLPLCSTEERSGVWVNDKIRCFWVNDSFQRYICVVFCVECLHVTFIHSFFFSLVTTAEWTVNRVSAGFTKSNLRLCKTFFRPWRMTFQIYKRIKIFFNGPAKKKKKIHIKQADLRHTPS